MTKSEIFKAAHKLTKETIEKGDYYSVNFSFCLSFIYSQTKNNKMIDFFEVKTNGGDTYNCTITNNICKINVKGVDFTTELRYFKGFECVYIKPSDKTLLNMLGVPKRMQRKPIALKTVRQKERKQMPTVKSTKIDYTQTAEFKNAKSTDMVNSGYGYMVEKSKYYLAQKLRYDGIEKL